MRLRVEYPLNKTHTPEHRKTSCVWPEHLQPNNNWFLLRWWPVCGTCTFYFRTLRVLKGKWTVEDGKNKAKRFYSIASRSSINSSPPTVGNFRNNSYIQSFMTECPEKNNSDSECKLSVLIMAERQDDNGEDNHPNGLHHSIIKLHYWSTTTLSVQALKWKILQIRCQLIEL